MVFISVVLVGWLLLDSPWLLHLALIRLTPFKLLGRGRRHLTWLQQAIAQQHGNVAYTTGRKKHRQEMTEQG